MQEKTIAAYEARRQFGKMLRDVEVKGDNYVVERHGEPVAALVPLRLYEGWKREHEEFMEVLDDAPGGVDMTDDELLAYAVQLVHEVRAELRAERETVNQRNTAL